MLWCSWMRAKTRQSQSNETIMIKHTISNRAVHEIYMKRFETAQVVPAYMYLPNHVQTLWKSTGSASVHALPNHVQALWKRTGSADFFFSSSSIFLEQSTSSVLPPTTCLLFSRESESDRFCNFKTLSYLPLSSPQIRWKMCKQHGKSSLIQTCGSSKNSFYL